MVERGRTILLLGLLLFLPPALATGATGGFTLQGPASFPLGTTVDAPLQALLAKDSDGINGYNLGAETVEVHHYERRYLGLPGQVVLRSETTERTWRISDVTAQLVQGGDHSGFVAIHRGQAHLSFTSSGSANVEHRHVSNLSSDKTPVSDRRDLPAFFKQVVGDHLYIRGPGKALVEGPAEMKVFGPDLTITSSENVTPVTFETGRFQTSPTEVAYRWFVFVYEGSAEISSRAPIEVLAGETDIEWSGTAFLTPTAGTLMSDGAKYEANGTRASLTGSFTATLTPTPEGLYLGSLQGDLQDTTLQGAQRVPMHAAQGFGPLEVGLLMLGLVAVGTGAAAMLLRRRDRARPRPSTPAPLPPLDVLKAEEKREQTAAQKTEESAPVAVGLPATTPWSYENRAQDAMESASKPGDYRTAADLFSKARAENPTKPELARSQALALLKAGDLLEAMVLFETAAEEDFTGDSDRWAALCALRLGQPDAAEVYLARCLDRQGLQLEIVDEIVEHHEFRPLMRRLSIVEGLEAARQRLPREDEDDS